MQNYFRQAFYDLTVQISVDTRRASAVSEVTAQNSYIQRDISAVCILKKASLSLRRFTKQKLLNAISGFGTVAKTQNLQEFSRRQT